MASDQRLLSRDPDDPWSAHFKVLVRCSDEDLDAVRRVVDGVAQRVGEFPTDPQISMETDGSGVPYVAVDEAPGGVRLAVELDEARPEDADSIEPMLRAALAGAGLDVELAHPPKARRLRQFGRHSWAGWLIPHPDIQAERGGGAGRVRPLEAWTAWVVELLDKPGLVVEDDYWAGKTGVHPSSSEGFERELAMALSRRRSAMVVRGSDPAVFATMPVSNPLAVGVTRSDRPRPEDAEMLRGALKGVTPQPGLAFLLPSDTNTAGNATVYQWQPWGSAKHLYLSQAHGLLDRCVFDAAWWTLLGPGHVRRLQEQGADELLNMLEPVAGDEHRWELIIGEPEDWMSETGLVAVTRDRARELIAPLVPTREEIMAESARQNARAARRAAERRRKARQAWQQRQNDE